MSVLMKLNLPLVVFSCIVLFLAFARRKKLVLPTVLIQVLLSATIATAILGALLEAYYMRGCSTSAVFHAKTLQIQSHGFDVLESVNCPYWLDFGSLLFSVREQSMPYYDTDGDISIEFTNDTLIEKVRSAFENLGYVTKHREPRSMIQVYGKAGRGPHLDLFYWRTKTLNGRKFLVNDDYTVVMQNRPWDMIFPLQNASYIGRETFIPNKPHDILRREYGEDYMTPRVTRWECMENVLNGYLLYYNPHMMAWLIMVGIAGSYLIYRASQLRNGWGPFRFDYAKIPQY